MIKNLYLLTFLTLLSLCSCHNKNSKKTLKLSHGLDVNHSVHLAMLKMGEELYKKSNGTLSLEIYPNQQLGTERQNIELLQIGSLDMTKVSAAIENFNPKMKIFGFPYLFKDRDHAFRVLDGPIGKELLQGSAKYRIIGLGYYDAGSRNFYTKDRPIKKPEDLQGLKVRVMESVTDIAMVKSLGGSPTPISWGELYTSLQQGVVDGAENNLPSFHLSRHYEICKYFSLNQHTVRPDILIVGTSTWNRLNKQEQKWLQDSVDASVKYQRNLWKKAEEDALIAIKKAGVTVFRPDKQPFIEKTSAIYDACQDQELLSLVQQIKNTK